MLQNDLVLARLRVDSGEIRSYKKEDASNSIGLWNFDELGEFLGSLTETKEVYIRLFFRASEVTDSLTMNSFELRSFNQSGIQKLRGKIVHSDKNLEPFVFSIDKHEQSWWEFNSPVAIESHGILNFEDFYPKVGSLRLNFSKGFWLGDLHKGQGFFQMSLETIGGRNESQKISFPVNFNLRGSGGALDGRLQQNVVPESLPLLEMTPIWFRYQPDFHSSDGFKGLRTLISSQSFPLDFKFFSDSLDLKSVSDFVTEIFPEWEVSNSWVAGLNLKGKLSKISGYMDGNSGIGIYGSFKGLSTDSHKGVPRVANLAGSVYLHSNGFLFELDSSDSRVMFPNVFDHLWYSEKLSGKLISWFDQNYFSLVSRDIESRFREMEVDGSFSLSRAALEENRSLSLFFETPDLDLVDRHQYVPKVLPLALVEWLDDDLLTGELSNLHFAYHGQIKHADYSNSRRIELKGEYEDLRVRYLDGWPVMEDAKGNVHLKGAETSISVVAGNMLGIQDLSAELIMDNLNADLSADVNFTSKDNGIISFILNSPLKEELSFLSNEWQSRGIITGNMDLSFPFSNVLPSAIDLDIRFQLSDFDLMVPDYDLDFQSLEGKGGFYLPHHLSGDFQGKLFNEKISIKALSDRDSLKFALEGLADTEMIKVVTELSIDEYLEGSFEYFAEMVFATNAKNRSNFTLETDLEGMTVKLPLPFFKAQKERIEFKINIDFTDDKEFGYLSYADHDLFLTTKEREVINAAIAFSGKTLPKDLPQNNGLVMGELEAINLAAYLDLISFSEPLDFFWKLEDLQIEQVSFNDIGLQNVTANGKLGGPVSKVEIQSQLVDGAIEIEKVGNINIDLDRLDLSIFGVTSFTGMSTGKFVKDYLSELPNMIFSVDRLSFDEQELGAVSFVLRGENSNLEFYPFSFDLKGIVSEEAYMRWDLTKNDTKFNGSLFIEELDLTLKAWEYQPSIISESTEIAVDFSWKGTPFDFDLSNLRGVADFNLKDGRFVEMSPAEGGMKLASLLNFSKIFGRLSKLDFSDVRGRGIGYETVEAKVRFDEGMVSFVQPMIISSTSSRMRVGGTINLLENSLDNELIVTLPVSESLPWYAAYLAVANPIAGLGVIVGERVFRKPIEKFSSGKFRVKGAISDPDVSFIGLWDQKVEIDSFTDTDLDERFSD
ncbi:MAG: YhdP family protein [Candidatus Azotimanducaceae bacterium]